VIFCKLGGLMQKQVFAFLADLKFKNLGKKTDSHFLNS